MKNTVQEATVYLRLQYLCGFSQLMKAEANTTQTFVANANPVALCMTSCVKNWSEIFISYFNSRDLP